MIFNKRIQPVPNVILATVLAVAGGFLSTVSAEASATCLNKDQLSDLQKLYEALEGRRVVVDASRPYPGTDAKLKETYEGVIESGRTVALITNVREIETGKPIHDGGLTGTFFYSKCHLITNRHGVNKLGKVRLRSPERVEEVVSIIHNPTNKVVSDIELGHIDGRIDKAAGTVIYVNEMGSPDDLDGDLAILRLDRPMEKAQLFRFLPYDDPQVGDGTGRHAVTYGYSYDLQERPRRPSKLVSDLSCEVRSRSAAKGPCDVSDHKDFGYHQAFNTSCVAAGGASGSPIFVEGPNGKYSIRGLSTRSGFVDKTSGTSRSIGTSTMRGFTKDELMRLRQIVQRDIQQIGLTGCR
jgi:hypothetical protein